MTFKHWALIILASTTLSLFSQTQYGILAPDSIRKKCDDVIISEIGKTAFSNSIKFIKCDLQKGTDINGDWLSYVIFYAFTFPNIQESHVVFSLTYKKDAKNAGVIKDATFRNYTRLPLSLKTKPPKVVSYNEARKTASLADPVLKKNADKLYGELSTEFDEKKKDYNFVWYYYFMEECKNCTDPFKIHSAYVDAASGKLITVPPKSQNQ